MHRIKKKAKPWTQVHNAKSGLSSTMLAKRTHHCRNDVCLGVSICESVCVRVWADWKYFFQNGLVSQDQQIREGGAVSREVPGPPRSPAHCYCVFGFKSLHWAPTGRWNCIGKGRGQGAAPSPGEFQQPAAEWARVKLARASGLSAGLELKLRCFNPLAVSGVDESAPAHRLKRGKKSLCDDCPLLPGGTEQTSRFTWGPAANHPRIENYNIRPCSRVIKICVNSFLHLQRFMSC